jgi:hypothetical protein
MKVTLSIPELVDSYREHLRQHAETHISFTYYCNLHGVRPASASQWLRRKGMSVSALYYSVILEKVTVDPTYVLPSVEFKRINSLRDVPGQRTGSANGKSYANTLRGVNIIFPDGTQISIRETTATGLTKFIDLYNKLDEFETL